MVSEDGRTWTLRASARGGTEPAWHPSVLATAILVAVASSGAGNRVMTSSPGGSWMQEQSETITAKTLADVGSHTLPIKANGTIAASVQVQPNSRPGQTIHIRLQAGRSYVPIT